MDLMCVVSGMGGVADIWNGTAGDGV